VTVWAEIAGTFALYCWHKQVSFSEDFRLYTGPMRVSLFLGLALACGSVLFAQERQIPKDSVLLTMQGCAKGRTFTVGPRSEHQPANVDVSPGRRFRLSGSKKILEEIRKRQEAMVEITGLVRKGQLSGPGGVSIAGGRIRIGGATPQNPIYSDPRRDPGYNQVVIDVESWAPLPDSCPAR
jgi:hypothetical protein